MRLRWPLGFGVYRWLDQYQRLESYVVFSWTTVDNAGNTYIRFSDWRFKVRDHDDVTK